MQAGHLRSPSTRYDVIDALTIVPTAGGGCVGQATTGSSSTTTSLSTTTTTTTAMSIGDTTSETKPTSPPVNSPCKPDQWVAEWYSNPELKASPVAQTCEPAIDNTWKYDPPGVKGVPKDQFSVRWTGTFTAADSGQYTFTAYTDDGIRVMVDGERVIDSWRDQATTRYDAMVKLGAGEHTVVVEFYENGGEATARVSYTPA